MSTITDENLPSNVAVFTGNNSTNNNNEAESASETGDWVLVEDGILKGVTLMVHIVTGEAISFSTRSCRDEDRWEKKLPDLSSYTSALEVLDLYKSRYLTEFDASCCGAAPKLQKLFLTRCDHLSTIAPSIGSLQNLTELNFFDSPKITHLPGEIGNLTSLKKLIFGGSNGVANKALKTLPETLGQLVNLEELVLDHCKAFQSLPDSIGNLKKLSVLHMRACKLVTELPESIGNCSKMMDVSLAKCSSLKSLPESIQNWTELEDLVLMKCKSLTELPTCIGNCKKLTYLSLRSCVKLEKLPSSLEELPRLRTLDLAMCDNLKMIPTWLVGVSWRMEPLDLSHRLRMKTKWTNE